MKKETLLVADNLAYYLEATREFLEHEGYDVITASNAPRARKILEQGGVDLAILDIRLNDDNAEDDRSGLELAQEVQTDVPKIILTNFPDWEAVREALAPGMDGLPPAVDFVKKDEGPEAILHAIEWALHRSVLRENLLHTFGVPSMMALPARMEDMGVDDATARLNKSFESTARQLTKFQEEEMQQARRYHMLALIMAVTGMIVIVVGAALTFIQLVPQTLLTSVTAVLLEAVSILFFRREDAAHKQVEAYYNRLAETNKLASLLTICDTIKSEKKREEYKRKLIDVMIKNWFKPE
jgi:CheY-like chemotaxis protein